MHVIISICACQKPGIMYTGANIIGDRMNVARQKWCGVLGSCMKRHVSFQTKRNAAGKHIY